MRSGFFWAAIFLISATQCYAKEVKIRSGEHSEFSRLVIDSRVPLRWNFKNFAKEAIVTVIEPDIIFDLSKVFDLIPRTRISSVESVISATSTTLMVKFACICHIVVSNSAKNVVIIDVRNGIAEETSGESPPIESQTLTPNYEQFAPTSNATTDTTALFFGNPLALPDRYLDYEPTSVDYSPEELVNTVGLDAEEPSYFGNSTNPLNNDNETDNAENIAVEAAQMEMLEQLTKSIDQGIIELVEDDTIHGILSAENDPGSKEDTDFEHNGKVELSPQTAEVEGVEKAVAPEESAVRALEQLSAQSVFERDGPRENWLVEDVDRSTCISEQEFEMASWAKDASFNVQLADLNSKLLGEFDHADPEAVLNLAKFYIHFGFGAEALNTLIQFGANLPETPMLVEMAHIVDEIPYVADNSIFDGSNCDTAEKLWATLARGYSQGDQALPEAKLFEAFGNLPIELRRLLAPRLGMILLNSGNVKAAERIFLLVTRAAGQHGLELEQLKSDLERNLGNFDDALSSLEKIIGSNSTAAYSAMPIYVDLLLDQKLSIPENLLLDVSAMIRLQQGEPVGKLLSLAEIKLKAGTNSLTDALTIYRSEISNPNSLSASEMEILAELFTRANFENDASEDFVQAVLTNSDLLEPSNQFEQVRLNIAGKLLSLGLPEQSIEILLPLVNAQVEDALILAARSSLDLSKPDQALEYLSEIQSDDATSLRSEALVALEQNYIDAPLSVQNSSRDGPIFDWREALASDSAEIRQLAQLFADAPAARETNFTEDVGKIHHGNSQTSATITLSQVNDLLKSTDTERNTLQSLFSATTID